MLVEIQPHHQGHWAGDASPDVISDPYAWSHGVQVNPAGCLGSLLRPYSHAVAAPSYPATASHDTTPTLSWQPPADAVNPRGIPSPRAEQPPARCTPWIPVCDGQWHLLNPALIWDTPCWSNPIKALAPVLRHFCSCFQALMEPDGC